MPSFRGSSRPGVEPKSPEDSVLQVDSLPLSHWGSPMTNLDRVLKSRDITLPTKVCIVKAMFFFSNHV